nr:cupin domain-containing protein [Belnapia rosea]
MQRHAETPAVAGPASNFTGTVHVTSRFQAEPTGRVAGGVVTFQPGARTNWHTHPRGQTLIVTAGQGWVQSEGGAVQQVGPGDVVVFAPGVRHWHGATPTQAMTHVAVAEAVDGISTTWLETVTDEQYGQGAVGRTAASP